MKMYKVLHPRDYIEIICVKKSSNLDDYVDAST